MKQRLSSLGYIVNGAESWKVAQKLIAAQAPNLLISKIQDPKAPDGEILQKISINDPLNLDTLCQDVTDHFSRN